MAWSVLPRRASAAGAHSSVEFALLPLLLLLALAMRWPGLGEPIDSYDEGVHLESLLLLAQGYEPFAEIAAAQGPLHLHSHLPFFLLFGQSLLAARLAVVSYSLLGLLGVWWIGRQVAGPWAGLAALALLAVSPTYLRFSRQVLADVPALGPTILAFGAALAYRRGGRERWLVAAGVLLALGLLVKPLVVPAVPAVLALAWPAARGRSVWRGPALLAGAAAATVLLALLALEPRFVFEDVLSFRAGAREAYGWSLSHNWELLVDKLDQEQPGFFQLALVGAGLLATRPDRRATAALGLWALASLGLLLAHSPLRYHHMVILLPPLAILGGAAASGLHALLSRVCRARRALAAASLAALVVYTSSVPELARRDALLLRNVDAAGADSGEVDDELAAVERIRRLTRPDDFIVTDHPYLAFLAGRRVPPELVDPSEARLRSGDLTDAEVVALANAYAPELIVLWNGKLSRLPGFMAWAEGRYTTGRRFGTVDDDQPRAILRDPDP